MFLPVIGLLVGGISAAAWFAAALLFPHSVSVLFSMIVAVLLTGAFHEDGFVDSCDGLGGGMSIEKKLHIMKDSRVGAYGLIGAILLLLLKYSIMQEMPAQFLPATLMLAHILSRLVPVYLVRILPYVRDSGAGKSHHEKGAGMADIIFATTSAIALAGAICAVFGLWALLYALAALPILIILTAAYLHHQVRGYTGDLLGASQQISEAVLLALLWIICSYSP